MSTPQQVLSVDISHLIGLRHASATLDLARQRKVLHDAAGIHRSRFRGRGMEFSEVRAYQPGDDLRDIDWRVTARTRKPHTRLYQEERERPVLMVVDQCRPMFFGTRRTFKSVAAAEASALLAWSALRHGDRVGGLVFNEERAADLRPRRSRNNVLRLLDQIAGFGREPAASQPEPSVNPLDKALRDLTRIARPGSLLILISDFNMLDDSCAYKLQELARHNDLIAVRISDPLEHELPPPGRWVFTSAGERVQVDSRSAQDRSRYADMAAKKTAFLQNQSTRLRMPLIELGTADEPISVLAAGLGLSGMAQSMHRAG